MIVNRLSDATSDNASNAGAIVPDEA